MNNYISKLDKLEEMSKFLENTTCQDLIMNTKSKQVNNKEGD